MRKDYTPEALRAAATKRFWAKVDKRDPDECWEWKGVLVGGYGVLMVLGRRVRAHRFAFELNSGPIPPGMFVCHRCDNPPCCNPAHLFLGTPKDNNADMMAKGRYRHTPRFGVEVNTARLDEPQVVEIRRRWAHGETQVALASHYRVSRGAIQKVVHGRSWRHVTEGAAA